MATKSTNSRRRKRAFVFTLDALLVLPLIILIISSLIAFSATLKDNVLLHEYTYMVAKDSLGYLAELRMGEVSVAGLRVESSEENMSVLGFVTTHISNSTATKLAVEGTLNPKMPAFAGYIFEYKNDAGGWTEIGRGGNLAKLTSGLYSFQVSSIKVVTGLTDPTITGDACSGAIVCNVPQDLYEKGEIIGPMMFRIRVFA
ncbi:MAG: hypothetical protein QW112_00670 [Candidatus Micrarchaeia archaeon]